MRKLIVISLFILSSYILQLLSMNQAPFQFTMTPQEALKALELSSDLDFLDSKNQSIIRKAYLKLSLQLHPDRHPTASRAEVEKYTEKFKTIVNAYENLQNYYAQKVSNPPTFTPPSASFTPQDLIDELQSSILYELFWKKPSDNQKTTIQKNLLQIFTKSQTTHLQLWKNTNNASEIISSLLSSIDLFDKLLGKNTVAKQALADAIFTFIQNTKNKISTLTEDQRASWERYGRLVQRYSALFHLQEQLANEKKKAQTQKISLLYLFDDAMDNFQMAVNPPTGNWSFANIQALELLANTMIELAQSPNATEVSNGIQKLYNAITKNTKLFPNSNSLKVIALQLLKILASYATSQEQQSEIIKSAKFIYDMISPDKHAEKILGSVIYIEILIQKNQLTNQIEKEFIEEFIKYKSFINSLPHAERFVKNTLGYSLLSASNLIADLALQANNLSQANNYVKLGKTIYNAIITGEKVGFVWVAPPTSQLAQAKQELDRIEKKLSDLQSQPKSPQQPKQPTESPKAPSKESPQQPQYQFETPFTPPVRQPDVPQQPSGVETSKPSRRPFSRSQNSIADRLKNLQNALQELRNQI